MTAMRHATGFWAIFLAGVALLANAGPAAAACGDRLGACRHRQSVPDLHYVRSEAGHLYGAIAYSKRDGSFGWSTGFGDSESANEYALDKCSQRGSGCYVVISFSNLCASVSVDTTGGVFWGTAGTRQEAQRQSQLYCGRDGGPNCRVLAWACSYP